MSEDLSSYDIYVCATHDTGSGWEEEKEYGPFSDLQAAEKKQNELKDPKWFCLKSSIELRPKR